MSKFAQKHAQISFCNKFKKQNGHEIRWKSNPQYRNLQQTSPKNKRILIKTIPRRSNLQVLKKLQIHKNTRPNSRENRKVGNTGSCHFTLSHCPSTPHLYMPLLFTNYFPTILRWYILCMSCPIKQLCYRCCSWLHRLEVLRQAQEKVGISGH